MEAARKSLKGVGGFLICGQNAKVMEEKMQDWSYYHYHHYYDYYYYYNYTEAA